MKMVIADDESLIRASLSSMIKDMEASWQIVSEATNGEELLELIAEHKPNIAIVDIRMPKVQGLDAIRLGKIISPLTKWVILSGYSDFAYAQQAMKLGVSEYLLKPVDPIELEKTLQLVYKDNKEYICLLNQQFENSLFALCNGLTSLKHEARDSLYYQGRFIGWTFYLDTAQPASWVADVQREFYTELHACMEKHLVYGMNLALLALPNGELAAVGAWDTSNGHSGKQPIYDCFSEMEQIINDSYRSEEMLISVLRTGECQGFEEVNRRLQQLQQWGDLRSVCGIGQSLEYVELIKEAVTPHKVEASRLLCAIGHHLQDGMYLSYQNGVNELEVLLQKSDWFNANKEQPSLSKFMGCTLGLVLQEAITDVEMIRELRQYGEKKLQGTCSKETSVDLVKQVIQYIEKHYMDDIGIGQIAGQLNVSANYLSTLFHKKTGMMFVKYLTRIRMMKAKELLMNTNLQVKQVAEQVGYYSTRHFTKVFTQAFGSYPSDCRKNQLQSNS
ncbi:two-component system, response regulator YesN [Paenibacillus sp. 1_12]|nr:two-component system, response regulator YesN [Paenibacillus sp. 1_12]